MKIILGPPGTGKTTRLLELVEQELAQGVQPDEIAFVAFTRKAAREARSRAMERFNLVEDDLPYFKTLHSLAFGQMHLNKSEVMGTTDYNEIGQYIGMTFGRVEPEDDNELPTGATDKRGANCMYLEQIARLTQETLENTCRKYALENFWDVHLYTETLTSYKASRHKSDFTDMIEMFIDHGQVPNIKVLVIDEAQDLTPLQWQMAEKLMATAQRVYIAGDDDQAIYEWAGASVDLFQRLAGEFEVLPTSHRLPRKVYQKALRVLSTVKDRYGKTWGPRDEEGRLMYYVSADQVDFSNGSWYLLTRNRYTMIALSAMVKSKGFPFVMYGKSSVDNDNVRALTSWETLRKGEAIYVDAARLVCRKLRGLSQETQKMVKTTLSAIDSDMVIMSDLTKMGITVQGDWMEALDIPDGTREYFRAIRRKGESLFKSPRITISTIHQVKGGEAEHVLVVPDMSEACYRGMQRNPDVEGRVFYVAVTRARESLHIVEPRTNRYFDLRS